MTQTKVKSAMLNKTPIRLVAIEEEPPADDEEDVTLVQEFPAEDDATSPDGTPAKEDATPVKSMPEHEAITRRVPAVASPAVQAPEWPKPTRTWRRFLPAVVALVPLLAGLVAWLASRSTQPPASPSAAAAFARKQPEVIPVPAPHPVPVAVPVAMPASEGKAAPEVIRLQITAEPIEAELSLDGNVLAGHRLNLEVPKDRGIHVVSASAPGYFPFNQQVSFSNDIVLQINLRRAHGSGVRQVARQRPSRAEARTQTASKAGPPAPVYVEPKPQNSTSLPSARPAPRLEPGMDLEAPATRRGAKSIDERNPYRP